MSNKKLLKEITLIFFLLTMIFNVGGCGGGSSGKISNSNSEITYLITFDTNGGSDIPEQEVKEEERATQPNDPELEGYVFVTWLDENGETFNFNSPIYENRTLTAEWLNLAEATDEELNELKNAVFGGKTTLQIDSPDFSPLTEVEVTYDFIDTAGVVEISPITDGSILGTSGLLGLPVDIKSDLLEFTETTITFHYDPKALSVSPSDLSIFWYDEENDKMVLLSNDTVLDTETNTLKLTTNHFSIYGVVSISQWEEVWSKRISKIRTNESNYNVVLILDISYSMYGTPINNAVASAQNMIDILDDEDYVSVLYFSSTAKEVIATTKIENNRDTIKNNITVPSYSEMGGTNIQSALELSLSYNKSDLTNFIILLSDGESTAVNDTILQSLKNNNMKVITVGLGNSVDTKLLEKIANATDGGYIYVSNSQELQTKFEEIANADLGVKPTDDDKDKLPDELEKSGLRDFSGYEWVTDPKNLDTDGDGILDGDEIIFNSGLAYYNVNYVSNPLITTEKESSPLISIPDKVYCEVDNLDTKKLTLKFRITNYLYKKYGNKEVIYPSVEASDLSYTIVDLPEGFTSGTVNITKKKTSNSANNSQKAEVDFWPSFTVTYPENQSRTLKTVNIKDNASSSTMILTYNDVPVEYINTQIRSYATEQAERVCQKLETQYIQSLLKKIQGIQEDDSEVKDSSSALQAIMKEITPTPNSIYTKGSVPKEVYQAFAEAIHAAIQESAVTEYNMKLEDLVKKPMNFITGFMKEWAAGIAKVQQKATKVVTVGNKNYTVEMLTLSYGGSGVASATVKNGKNEWLLTWTMNNKELHIALGNYCAVLMQLSESIVEQFWEIYINEFLSSIGSNKTVSQAMLHNAGLVIKVLCGGEVGEQAAKELADATIQYLKSKTYDSLKQKLQTITGDQFKAEIENFIKNIPGGKTYLDLAPRLQKISDEYGKLKEAIGAYQSFSRGSGGSPSQAISDVEKAYKGFKSVYDKLNDESIFTNKEDLIDIILPKN